VKYGIIPELVGRLPVIVGLENLDRDALVRILAEPKNSLVKQYRKLFEMDNIELEFDDEALQTIAARAIDRNTGARGLRSIIEETMTDLMFSLPSRKDVAKVTITKDCVEGRGEPVLTLK
jgi:ATP-dependent Clp protease ATP-binding subunit ClpX